MTVLGTTLATMLTMIPGGDVSVTAGPGHDIVTLRLGDQQIAIELPEGFDAAQLASEPSALRTLLEQILADDEPDLIAESAPEAKQPEALPADAEATPSDEGDQPAPLAKSDPEDAVAEDAPAAETDDNSPAAEAREHDAVASDTDSADTSDNQAKADEQDQGEQETAVARNADSEAAPESDDEQEVADAARHEVEDRPTEETSIDDSEVIVEAEAPETADEAATSDPAASARAESDSAVSSTDDPSDGNTAEAAPSAEAAEAAPADTSPQSNVDEGDAIPDDDTLLILPISTWTDHVHRIHHDLRLMVRSLYRD